VIDATIAIVTKDRREELRRALTSATAQLGSVEVLVIDDGSTDGTAEMVRADFPKVRLHRFESSEGLVVRRNDAALLAHGRVIVSIDDDAAFSSPNSVAQTMQDFDGRAWRSSRCRTSTSRPARASSSAPRTAPASRSARRFAAPPSRSSATRSSQSGGSAR
jgi:glycosyltransferase involved in cell wall biosynthesis